MLLSPTQGASVISRGNDTAAVSASAGAEDGDDADSGRTEKSRPSNPYQAAREALRDPTSPESREVDALRKRDREVRAHEQAHLAAAGQYARGGPHYDYTKGPDGKRYAIGGHVNIDTSKVPGDPEATLRKAKVVQRAALAPAEPSPQDRRVAAQASSMALQAQREIQQLRLEEMAQVRAQRSEHLETRPGDGPAEVASQRTSTSVAIERGSSGAFLDLVA